MPNSKDKVLIRDITKPVIDNKNGTISFPYFVKVKPTENKAKDKVQFSYGNYDRSNQDVTEVDRTSVNKDLGPDLTKKHSRIKGYSERARSIVDSRKFGNEPHPIYNPILDPVSKALISPTAKKIYEGMSIASMFVPEPRVRIAMNLPLALYTLQDQLDQNTEFSPIEKAANYVGVIPEFRTTFNLAKGLSKNTQKAVNFSHKYGSKSAFQHMNLGEDPKLIYGEAALVAAHRGEDAQNIYDIASDATSLAKTSVGLSGGHSVVSNPVNPYSIYLNNKFKEDHPLIFGNQYKDGGNLDYNKIKQSYNDSNDVVSSVNKDTGWKTDFLRDLENKSPKINNNKYDNESDIANKDVNKEDEINSSDTIEQNVKNEYIKNKSKESVKKINDDYINNNNKLKVKTNDIKQANPSGNMKKYYDSISHEFKLYPREKTLSESGYGYLVNKKGISKEFACAIIGSALQESRMFPTEDNGSHKGILQWDKDIRFNNLINFTKQKEGTNYVNGDENLLFNQLDFALWEMKTPYFEKLHLMDKINSSKSIYDKVNYIKNIYLGDDSKTVSKRAAYGAYVYSMFNK